MPILLIAIVGMIIITSQSQFVFAGVQGGEEDPDGDNIFDPGDNCPNNYNPGQEDSDGDGIGDACEDGASQTTITSDVNGSVSVGTGETVVIANDATVNGNIEVNGGTLVVTQRSTLNGNIESKGGTVIIEDGSTILGNIQIEVSGAGGVLEINNASIDGNIESVGIDTLTMTNSYLTGNISSTDDNIVTITDNDVGKNITITSPNTCIESGNTAKKNSGCP